jgi:hypothetical protein
MLNQQEIDEFKKRAQAAGFTESQIAAEIQRKSKETQQSTSPLPESKPVATEEQPNQLSTKLSIFNKKTGERRQVSVTEASQYGIAPEDALTSLKSVRDAERLEMGLPLGEDKTTADIQNKAELKNEILTKSRALYEVIEQGESGILTGKEYKDALNFASSQLAAARAFSEGGKSLTGTEYSVLSGSMPRIKQPRKQNILERITGHVPEPTSEVIDDAETLKNKTLRLMAGFGDTQAQNLISKQRPDLNAPQEDKEFSLLGSALNLTVKPIYDGVKNYLGLLGTAAGSGLLAIDQKVNILSDEQALKLEEDLRPIIEAKYSSPEQIILSGALDTLSGAGAAIDIWTLGKATAAKQVLKGTIRLAAQNMAINAPLFGIGSALEASRNGENPDKGFVMGVTGQSTTGIFQGLYGDIEQAKDADTVLSIFLPIVAGRQNNLFGRTIRGEILQSPASMKVSIDGVFGRTFFKSEDSIGKTATSLVGVSNKKSVTQSEELAKSLIAITEETTPHKMARELPVLVEKSGNFIDARITEVDDIIGPQSRNEVINDVLSKVEQTTAAQARPDLYAKYKGILANKLRGFTPDYAPTTAKTGDFEFVNLKDINETRKWANSSINSNWFKNGMPLTSDADYINFMQWVGSQTMKDVIGQVDDTGRLGKAIEIQHISLSGEPVISNTAYTRTSGKISGKFSFIKNVWNHTIGSIVETEKIKAIRSQVGQSEAGQLAGEIRSSDIPASSPEIPPATNVTPPSTGRKPLSNEIVDTVLGKNKGSAGSPRKIRLENEQGANMRSGSRREQEKAIRQSKKKKYQ